MLLDRQELTDDDVLPVRAPALDALDLHAEQRQPLGELLRRELDVDVVASQDSGTSTDPTRALALKAEATPMQPSD